MPCTLSLRAAVWMSLRENPVRMPESRETLATSTTIITNRKKSMFKRHYNVRTLVALVVCLTGTIAIESDLLSEPAPSVSIDVSKTHADSIGTRPLSPIEEALYNPRRLPPLPPDQIDSETLWLARAIFSESKRLEEQYLVAWVIRNRVETKYRGKKTYQAVILDPNQFSAFRSSSQVKTFYTSLDSASRTPGWNQALRLAYGIKHTDAEYRPFSVTTRHFYSEQSMGSRRHPAWSRGKDPVEPRLSVEIKEDRFRFFDGIS